MPTPEAADTITKTAAPPPAELQRDVIGLLGAVTLEGVFLSPATALYGLFDPIFLAARSAAPLVSS